MWAWVGCLRQEPAGIVVEGDSLEKEWWMVSRKVFVEGDWAVSVELTY